MITLYGIKNCDTVKRARDRFGAAGIAHRFHDFRADGLAPDLVQHWLAVLGAQILVNRKGTSWRQLDAATQARIDAGDAAVIAAHGSVIKRPVIDRDGELRVGFAKAEEADVIAWARRSQ